MFLTVAGKALARKTRHPHQIVESFLCALGISPETAPSTPRASSTMPAPSVLEAFGHFVTERRNSQLPVPKGKKSLTTILGAKGAT